MFTKDLGLIMETSTINTMVSKVAMSACVQDFQLSELHTSSALRIGGSCCLQLPCIPVVILMVTK
jgi:hypothetical protein